MKATALSLLGLIFTVGLVAALANTRGGDAAPTQNETTNISEINGKQVITIEAKGGYWPRTTAAAANVTSAIKVVTNNTFDCSSALVIPALGYRANLPPTGEKVIDLPPQPPGTTLQGFCSMGMYNFSIAFN